MFVNRRFAVPTVVSIVGLAGVCFVSLSVGSANAGTPTSRLAEANVLRAFWNVAPAQLVEDAQLSSADAQHVAYLDTNSTCSHAEDSTKPGYTSSGNTAGTRSVVFCGSTTAFNPIQDWVTAPLHGEQLLNPRLMTTGYAESPDHAALDTLTHAFEAPAATVPLTWPNGSHFPLTKFAGNESDFNGGDAVATNCSADYVLHQDQLGAPLYVILPGSAKSAVPSTSGDVWLKDANGTPLPFCLWNSASPAAGRPFLTTAILLPRNPLVDGMSYTASYTAAGIAASWAFAVGTGVVPSGSSSPTASPSPTASASPTATASESPTASPALNPAPTLSQTNAKGTVTLTLRTAPEYNGLTVYFFRRSGMTGQVVPLGTGKVNSSGVATRTFDAKRGQILALYGKVINAAGITTPYSNTISFKVV